MLCDENHEMLKVYGAWGKKKFMGREYMGISRMTYVIDEHGILGQVINVYPNTSRVLLISDEQQSVAVTVKRTGQRAIVTGVGLPTSLSLNYVFKTSDVRVGDVLISSGLGGRIPAGYRVGTIAHIEDTQADNFKSIKVTPAANFVDNAYVLVLQDKERPIRELAN